ncbi:hypothetical protein ACIBL6_20470 [Streptomyces sp. NPDC050400]|uniref:hypothetical protein n=1 Tax=Streptomyces sp. NPDC050400 TaxID=3365610 RepID=UPI00378CF10A
MTLMPADTAHGTTDVRQPGFWAECLLQTPDADTLVGSYDAITADAALRWVRVLVRMLQSVLSEDETEPVTSWLLGGHLRSRTELANRRPFELILRPARQPGLELRFTARPVTFLHLAGRDPRELPSCSQQWSRPMAAATALNRHAPPLPRGS